MLDKEAINLLVEQIRYIILNKPLTEALMCDSEELVELQEAIFYLSDCLIEYKDFLRHLQMGELNIEPPSRHNFLAGNLKELHSMLNHLTWQANQIAHGDYSQRVSFLGDFSTSFNQMIHQLSERESKLKLQSTMLSETVDLLKSVMDGLSDWIIVTSKEDGEIVYANQSAQQSFYNPKTNQQFNMDYCGLLKYLKQYKQGISESQTFDYACDKNKKHFHVHSYAIQWKETLAYAHYIVDITEEKEHQNQIAKWAYTDELTNLHNRRFFLENLNLLVHKKSEFALCIIDLDGLKYANDNFGHTAGDQYLKTVSKQLTKRIPPTNMICRIGGDEFAVLFPNYNAQNVLDIMAQLNHTLTALSKDYPMSVSYGVTYIEDGASITSESVMEQADEKMYIMKNIKKTAKKTNGLTMIFAWTKDLETGNAQIDSEHKNLLQTLNGLLEACSVGRGESELNHAMDFLCQYTKTHFEHEQILQVQSGYPDYANHKKYHDWFILVVEDLSVKLRANGPSSELAGEISSKLGGWLLNHIKTEDVKVANHILSQQKPL